MHNGQIVGYTRVSTADQNLGRQLDGMHIDRMFEEKASGKDTNRPQLDACLAYVREGDTLAVHSMDRLARNLDDLRRIVSELTAKGVTVQFVKEGLAFKNHNDPMGKLMLSVMGAFAEFERSLILERQREGIALAKRDGKYKGRKPSLNESQVSEAKERLNAGVPHAKVARDFGVSRQTLYQYVK